MTISLTIISLILMAAFFVYGILDELRRPRWEVPYLVVATTFLLITANAVYQLS